MVSNLTLCLAHQTMVGASEIVSEFDSCCYDGVKPIYAVTCGNQPAISDNLLVKESVVTSHSGKGKSAVEWETSLDETRATDGLVTIWLVSVNGVAFLGTVVTFGNGEEKLNAVEIWMTFATI